MPRNYAACPALELSEDLGQILTDQRVTLCLTLQGLTPPTDDSGNVKPAVVLFKSFLEA